MRARAGPTTVMAILLVLASACTSGRSEDHPARDGIPRGGTLRLSMSFPLYVELDPQKTYDPAWELLRCCLLRTLLSYNGHDTAHGGAEVRPDLATSMPEISADGLTWTFHIRPHIHYAPPLERTEVVAQDFVRALQREGDTDVGDEGSLPGYAFYYSEIKGFDDYAQGRADSISGLSTPQDHTLSVSLEAPAGDLGYLFAMPATAPIPPSPADPGAPLGVATGHDDGYGSYLVSTGPYMVAGSADLDFSKPGAQRPVAGLDPDRSLTLVRNPSWSRGTDPLRRAYVDRIEIALGASDEDAAGAVRSGRADMVFSEHSDPAPVVRRYLGNPALRRRVHSGSLDAVVFINMNVAAPPFDDPHVRRAVNYAIDKQAVLRLDQVGGDLASPLFADVATHIAPDSLEGNLLLNRDPYGTPDRGGSLRLARQEMALSRYDRDHDGVCDAGACRSILAPFLDQWTTPAAARLLADDVRAIGLVLRVKEMDYDHFYGAVGDPRQRVPIGIGVNWAKDYPNGSTFFVQFHGGDLVSKDNPNNSLVGATDGQLEGWGYPTRSVPNVDARIDECQGLLGGAQEQCWAQLDQTLMQVVVPFVPLLSFQVQRIVSARVINMSFDQFASMPALDQIALEPGSG
jgi:peptide/nickel transport system substrate-binding protein